MTPQNLRRMLISRGVKGVIYVVNHLLSRDSIYLGDEFAYVSAGMRHPDLPIHYSINNLMSSGYQSIVELLRMGFKRPGVVVPEGIDDSLCHSFYGGVQSGLILCPEENRLPVLIVPGADLWIEDSNFPAVVRWLEQHRPDCILTTDSVQIQKLLASDRVTARPPVFSLDYYPDLPVEGGMDGLQEEVGAAAVALLALHITTGRRASRRPARLIVEGRWSKDKRKRPPQGRSNPLGCAGAAAAPQLGGASWAEPAYHGQVSPFSRHAA
jgi:LacI family transcriptional regulator